MTIERYLDHLVGPRPNGSAAIDKTAAFIERSLQQATPHVEVDSFVATPYGLAIVNAVTFLLMIAAVAMLLRRRYALSLAGFVLVPMIVLVEMELLWSPISGFLTVPAKNITASFPASVDSPLVVFTAHYDTATQIGDHVHWQYAALASSVAVALALGLAILGLVLKRGLPRLLPLICSPLILIPFAVVFIQQSIGPLVEDPSPGALDNAGSVAVLLSLADSLSQSHQDPSVSVEFVFLSCEEERALGSWRFVRDLATRNPMVVINLESVGSSSELSYVSEERYLIQSYLPSAFAVELVQSAAKSLGWAPLRPMELPGVMYTDGRSFLAASLPAVTLISRDEGGPRGLHSARDGRERLSIESLARARDLLHAIVRAAEHL